MSILFFFFKDLNVVIELMNTKHFFLSLGSNSFCFLTLLGKEQYGFQMGFKAVEMRKSLCKRSHVSFDFGNSS